MDLGRISSSWARRLNSSADNVPRNWPKRNPININKVICVVKALVDATPISGPAWVYAPESAARAIELPTTLQIPNT